MYKYLSNPKNAKLSQINEQNQAKPGKRKCIKGKRKGALISCLIERVASRRQETYSFTLVHKVILRVIIEIML